GREMVRHGAMPYRDMLDQKTPAIYLLYAALIRVFGEHIWGIRVAEWLVIVPFALGLARVATPRAEKTPAWLAGFAVLAANVFYFGFFDYWHTGQCEFWCAVLVGAALWVGLRAPVRATVGALLAGLACGGAILFKPTVGLLVVVVLGAIVAGRSSWRERLIASAAFALGGALAIGACVLWIVQRGAGAAAYDILVTFNRAYVAQERRVNDLEDVAKTVLAAHHLFDPLASFIHLWIVIGIVQFGRTGGRRIESPLVLPALVIVAGAASVIAQLKFYPYHWGIMIVGETLAMVVIVRQLAEHLAALRVSTVQARLVCVGAPLLLFALTGYLWGWEERVTATFRYLRTGDREAFLDPFRVEHPFHFFAKDEEAVGSWLRAHARPEDRLVVRDFHPTIYASSGLSYGGRFFWDAYLTDPRRRREEWLAQDRADLERIKPRWVVAILPRPDMHWGDPPALAAPEYFMPFGYRQVHEMYGYSIMELDAPPPP
ncbi:MAG TPA: glycosyltransferase family 39 protein, partial [Labilithrix sp.]|nr:glycosyltransferase family 39 protein [Labilithrix sp.]